MDAVKFFKTVNRLCKNQDCNVCPVNEKGRCMVGFDDTSIRNIEKTISKVEKWEKEHPVNTRQNKFLKMFPNADFCQDVIDISPCSIEKEMKKCCGDRECDECKRTYWLTEVTDNGND